MHGMNENPSDPDRRKAVQLYSVFGVSLVLMLVPNVFAAVLSLLFLLGVLIAAYMMRGNGESLAGNHAGFIIRTIWISGFFAILTLIAASLYMLPNIDHTLLDPCMQNITFHAERLLQNPDTMATIAEMESMLRPCIHDFIQSNYTVFGISLLIAAGPIVLYLIVRFTRGLARAARGYRVSHPKSWL